MAWKVDSASSVRELLSLVWQVFLGFFYWRKSPPPTQLIHDKPVQSFTYTHSPKSILKWTFSQIWESEKNRKHCHLVFSRFLQNVMCSREGFPGGSDSKESACKKETQVRSQGWEDPLEKGMASNSSMCSRTVLLKFTTHTKHLKILPRCKFCSIRTGIGLDSLSF